MSRFSVVTRRQFLRTAGSAAAGLTILGNAASVRATPANDRISLAFVGLGGRGGSLMAGFAQRPDCRIVCLCDPKSSVFANRVKEIAQLQGGKEPACVQDIRRALDDKAVDAIVVATPDHWHCLAAVWGCQAGKDVYVEKPLSHSCWEGRKAVEAARKYQRVVQVGTQNRSAAYNMEAKKYLDEGQLGRVHLCRVFNQKGQENFPAVADGTPPKTLDWNIFNGPAPESRYNSNYISHWHAFWRYSGGDIANDGVHQLDLARWLMGVELPKSVYCAGGRFDSAGADETPDTQVATYEFDNLIMTFELTLYTPYMLKIAPQIRESAADYPYWPQCATRIEIYGSKGVMYVGRHGGGWQVFVRPKNEKPVLLDQGKGHFPDPEHKENFIQCIRSRQLPNADVEKGHRSALLVHYANISFRCGGQKLQIDPQNEQIVANPAAMELFKRTYRKPWVIGDEV